MVPRLPSRHGGARDWHVCAGHGPRFNVVVSTHEALLTLAAAAPSFSPDWDTDDPIEYVEVGDLVRHLHEELRAGRTAEVTAVFDTAERLLHQAPSAENFIQIGFLESVQNTAGHAGLVQEAYEPFLGPLLRLLWDALNDLWGGSTTPSK